MHSGETRFGAGSGQRDPPGSGLRAEGLLLEAQCRFGDGGVMGGQKGLSRE